MKENCLNCDLFLSCRNKRKSSTFVCDDYEEFQIKQNRFIEDLFGREAAKTDTSAFSLNTDYDSKELDLVAMLESVLDSKTSIVPRDLKINDGDIKEYPNFYEFVTDPKGLGVSPFPRQMFLALWLFADFCVHCSDPDYYEDIFQIPVDMPISEFPERFQMLEFGVCPCCGKDRRDLFRSKMLHPYRELALVAGQRGGKSMFTSILVCYLLHRYLKLQKPTEVFGLLSNTTLVGTFVALTFQGASELLWAPIRDLIGDSPWFCVGFDSKITLSDNTNVQICDLKVGARVKTLEGSSKVLNVFDNGVRECLKITLDDEKILTGTKEHKVRVLGADGCSIEWKLLGDLTEEDYVVVE